MDLKPFVTIIGENNIGKSNLLDAISLVLSRDIMAYRRRALEVSDFNFDALKEFKASVKSGDLENLMFPEVRVDLYFFELDTEQEAVLDYYRKMFLLEQFIVFLCIILLFLMRLCLGINLIQLQL